MEMVSVPDPTCAPAPMARLPRLVAPSQVVVVRFSSGEGLIIKRELDHIEHIVCG